jgi:hypothetical protein
VCSNADNKRLSHVAIPLRQIAHGGSCLPCAAEATKKVAQTKSLAHLPNNHHKSAAGQCS